MGPPVERASELVQMPLAASGTATLALISCSIWLDSLTVPAYCAILSAALLLIPPLKGIAFGEKKSYVQSEDPAEASAEAERNFSFGSLVDSVGSVPIVLYRSVQLLDVLALLVLSVIGPLHYSTPYRPIVGPFSFIDIVQVALYIYLSILGGISLLASTRVNVRAFVHLSSILAIAWGVYLYRDVWPLATVDLSPQDEAEGFLLWAKLALLTLSGVIIPLNSPRKYIPLDPKDPLEPHPEQTASLLSLLIYLYMEPTIWLAWRLPRLTFDMLSPLPDYDHLKNLVGRTFPRLDPMRSKSRQHIALQFVRVFWVEVCNLAAMSITAVVAAFAAPISINQLLKYLESGREEAHIRPWFWIALFFSGKVFKDLSDLWFLYYESRLSIRIQAVITELVFEHALRVRMEADTSDSVTATPSSVSTEAVTSDNASHDGPEGDGSLEGEESNAGDAPDSATASSSTAVPPSTTSSIKGKGKEKSSSESGSTAPPAATPAPSEMPESKTGASEHLIGRINNLVSSDLSNLEYVGTFAVFISVESPFQVILCMVFLYQILGWSALVGLATMLITLPLPGYVTKHIQGSQREKMKRTDARVQTVTEMMNVIRMIKLFGWEPRVSAQLDKKREEELVWVRKNKLLSLSINLCNYMLPILIMLTTFFTYASATVIMKEKLTASRVFSAMSVFDMLRIDLHASFFFIPQLIQAKVSLERIAEFLRNTELIDKYDKAEESGNTEIFATDVPEERKGVIGIRHASFTWSKEALPSQTPGGTRKRAFVLHIDDEVIFQRGKINLIVGPTGAGKTSLLMALLGEMHYIPAGPDSFVSLPREGGIAYAAQESWVQNETIRNNILFGAPYDEVRYKKVLHQCALERDLSLFDAGDQTEVGEKGITLSGGQKARITLARAVYSYAEILLLDDILAALDVHTSKWIVEKCIKGELLQGRTIILVTHNVALASPVADFVVDMGSDGRILSQGTLESALERDSKLLKEIKEEQKEFEKAEDEVDSEKPEDATARQNAGKLVVAEEVEEGHVGWSALSLYLANMSKRPVLFWLIYMSGHIVRHFISNFQTWYLGYWAAQYETHPPEEVSVGHYLTIYTALVAAGMAAAAFCVFYYVFGSVRAARIVHKELVTSVLGTTLRWLDKTPTARIITRCTVDIQTLDTRFARTAELLVEVSIFMLLKMLAVVLFSPIFIIPAAMVAIAGGLCGHVFMRAQLSVKREMSNYKAPVLSHFGAAVGGITSVRAYGAEEAFKAEAYSRIDRYSRVAVTHENLNRWLSARIDFIGTLFATSLALYLTYAARLSASDAGFSLNMAAAFSGVIFQAIRVFNDFEISGNSLERIQQYLLIEQEPKPTPEGVPPAYWPASGHLEVDKLSARYSPEGPKVLHDVTFEVASGERVGIVGRTGSGKSSLTLALLRCILTEGHVRYDGLETEKINLDALRSNITIIPQVPELLSGTLRQNLDPFSEHDDAVLNDALRSAGLFNLQDENDQSRITLDTEIAGGGANLSVGQRQILALARAIVRRSKLLILDEATSAIDYETDSIIQTSLRTELGKDVTLLTVAHRLQTIMDADKIMVLDAGRIVEFGKPSELLKNETGMLRALVDESGDREKLYEMAMGASSS
ncbi:P-loop containing nucleoside triphosphate hydrolase protein [Pilatotrama ljubarskyi]|nr:P-loop containing nucleoside triphosphate hydrolase protein [Pilatotrama ljubarskyi]